jgi:glycosyltransferase involved in cell wall biosynthesis
MKIDILTPCFNSSGWIEQCILSVRSQIQHDECNINLTHCIKDGISRDGTIKKIVHIKNRISEDSDYRLQVTSEEDAGMYNALNKAFDSTKGEIVGHLNADEQYLPGTLKYVSDYFIDHPQTDVLFGAVVVVDVDGEYICSRIPLKPKLIHTQVCHLSTFTASMFFRRSAIEKLGTYFDESFKTAGDADLIGRMLKDGLRMDTVRRYFSTFIDSGENLALSKQAKFEEKIMCQRAPKWAQRVPSCIKLLHRLRKFFHRIYKLEPFEYSFTSSEGNLRNVTVAKPTGRWHTR